MTAKKQVRRKHVPIRTCIACGQSGGKRSLVRIVGSTEGDLIIDPTGKRAGRGAYLCQNPVCWDKVLSARDTNLARALRRDVNESAKVALRVAWQTQLNPTGRSPGESDSSEKLSN